MTDRKQEIIRLHIVEKLSFGKIAARLGVTRSSVASVINRAGIRNARGSERYHFNDLTGKKFDRLTALEPTTSRYKSWIVWKCCCDCGATCFVPSAVLSSGATRSCGCLRTEVAREHMRRIQPLGQKASRRKREMVA